MTELKSWGYRQCLKGKKLVSQVVDYTNKFEKSLLLKSDESFQK